MIGYVARGHRLWPRAGWATIQDLASSFASFPSGYMGLVDEEGGLQLYDGRLRLKDARGTTCWPSSIRPTIWTTWPSTSSTGRSSSSPTIEGWAGRRASTASARWRRLNVADRSARRWPTRSSSCSRQIGGGRPVEGSLYYHYARLIEDLYALERIGELLDDADILSKDIRTVPPARLTGHGVGVIEAPARHADPRLLDRRERPAHPRQPDRGHRPQQLGHERSGRPGGQGSS